MKKTKETENESNSGTEKKPSSHKRIKAADKKGEFIIQSNGNEYNIGNVKELCVKAYRGNTRKKIDTIDIYLKFEDGVVRAYYVVNGKAEGKYIDL